MRLARDKPDDVIHDNDKERYGYYDERCDEQFDVLLPIGFSPHFKQKQEGVDAYRKWDDKTDEEHDP